MRNIQKYALLGVMTLVVGCAEEILIRKPVTSRGKVGNPYVKYISPEPYWHYNFYPEPRWEYTYALYSFPYNVGFADFNCAEIDRPYWHGRHHDHKHRHHDEGHKKTNDRKPHHEGAPGSPQPIKPVIKNGTVTPLPKQVLEPSKVPPIKLPPLVATATQPTVVKPIPVRPEPPQIVRPEHVHNKPGGVNSTQDHIQAHEHQKPVQTPDDLEKPPVSPPSKPDDEIPVSNTDHAIQHRPLFEQPNHNEQTAATDFNKHSKDHHNTIHEQPKIIKGQHTEEIVVIEKIHSAPQQTQIIVKTSPMPVHEEKAALDLPAQPKENGITEPSAKDRHREIEAIPRHEKVMPVEVEAYPQHPEKRVLEPPPVQMHQPKIDAPSISERSQEVVRPTAHEAKIVAEPP
ncbi:MAG: hypothetical protein ABL933_09645, partial [Methyloglobulus sp.]